MCVELQLAWEKVGYMVSALDHELYGKWVSMYSSNGFTKIAKDCIDLINRIAQNKPEHELKKLEEIFVKASYFEYMFWDMAENISTWSVNALAKS